jgi:hypothetical protein
MYNKNNKTLDVGPVLRLPLLLIYDSSSIDITSLEWCNVFQPLHDVLSYKCGTIPNSDLGQIYELYNLAVGRIRIADHIPRYIFSAD